MKTILFNLLVSSHFFFSLGLFRDTSESHFVQIYCLKSGSIISKDSLLLSRLKESSNSFVYCVNMLCLVWSFFRKKLKMNKSKPLDVDLVCK